MATQHSRETPGYEVGRGILLEDLLSIRDEGEERDIMFRRFLCG